MVTSPASLRTENDYADEDKQFTGHTDMGCAVAGLAVSNKPNTLSSTPSPEDGNRFSISNFVFRSPDDWQSKNKQQSRVIHHFHNSF
jgi:hypothetical protein